MSGKEIGVRSQESGGEQPTYSLCADGVISDTYCKSVDEYIEECECEYAVVEAMPVTDELGTDQHYIRCWSDEQSEEDGDEPDWTGDIFLEAEEPK